MDNTYITYERDQKRIVDQEGSLVFPNLSPNEYPTMSRFAGPPELDDIYGPLQPSAYRPTWLIRVSDMARVRGSEVNDRYYALSYSQNQTGNCSKDNNGGARKHKFIVYRKQKARKHPRGRAKTRVAVQPKLLTLDAMLQKICKDFGIRYLWWDQWCTDQLTKEEEIKRRHDIYKNAYCTLILIPELAFTGLIDYTGIPIADISAIAHAEWMKQTWALQEAFLSKRLLFLGKNVHMWSHVSHGILLRGTTTAMFLHSVSTRSLKWNAAIALQYARKRTSDKAHDRYFALADMFREKMDGINTSYSQPLNELALWVHERLAIDDVSILYFGTPSDPDDLKSLYVAEQEESSSLPSWAGTEGIHVRRLFHIGQNASLEAFGMSPADYHVSGTSISINCTSISVSIEKTNKYDQNHKLWCRSVDYVASGSTVSSAKGNHLTFVISTGRNTYDGFRIRDAYGVKGTHFLPLKAEAGALVNTVLSPHIYGGVMSLTEDCDECIILSGVSYRDAHLDSCYVSPVVRKDGNHYKAVGICSLFEAPKLLSRIVSKSKQKFLIK